MIRALVLAMALALIVAPALRADGEQKSTAEKIKKLQKQRRDALEKAVAIRHKEFENGKCSLGAVREAAKELLDAELELATTREQRVAAHAARLKLAKGVEERMTARNKVGLVEVAEVFETQAFRLEAEIGWLKAGGKEKKEKKDK